MKLRYTALIWSFLLGAFATSAQVQPDLTREKWPALWITVPGESRDSYGVYHFKKEFEIVTVPSAFTVFVSADNRYKLFVNGQWVGHGPARGDLYHWNYEVVDLAPYLKSGKNTVSATVWNFGQQRSEAQVSYRTAFILQGARPHSQMLNTNESWQCLRDQRYSPLSPELIYTYYVAGPGENVDFNVSLDLDSQSKPALPLWNGVPKGVFDWSTGWMLVERAIPPMGLTEERLSAVRRADGIPVPKGFLAGGEKLIIPANRKILIWLDHGRLTNAYPSVRFSGGAQGKIRLSYAEALYKIEHDSDWRAQKRKGNRDEVEGKRFVGVTDQLLPDGQSHTYTTLWWRTYRYLQLEITTEEQPLVIEDLHSIFTGYPFLQNSEFSSSMPVLNKIYETGWRTARLCAAETYMDCPYYEQLQYVGDTRIQALVSLFNSGDDRLVRQAINQIDNSRMAEGLTLSRYPSANAQQIPTFSLWWIAMVHDFRKYRDDDEFIRSKLPGIRQVLSFFEMYQQADGSLTRPPYWEFTDWAEGNGWDRGVGPVGKDGHSAILDLQLCLALQHAAELEAALGSKEFAEKYRRQSAMLKETIRRVYWDKQRSLFSDTSDKTHFSQHANTLAILAGVVEGPEVKSIAEQLVHNNTLTPATIYFKYYVHQALHQAGLGDLYTDMLSDWKVQLANGLTTWAEISDHDNARSDCHAWGASPNIELLRIVLGIDSESPGFKTLIVEPHLGSLSFARGKMPHPNGTISANYQSKKGRWSAVIELPPGTSGRFIWKGKSFNLVAGPNSFDDLK